MMRWHFGCQQGKVAVLCLCAAASGVARANPNVPARVAPPQVESVAPREVANRTGSAIKVPAVLAQLLAHQISVDDAWQSGALNVNDLRYIFENYLSPWGLFDERDDASLRRALMALLVQHDGEGLKTLEKLSPTLRLWLADYYGNIGDKYVLNVVESILSQAKPKMEGQEDLVFQAIVRLGWYYRDEGEWGNSAQAWLRMKDYAPAKSWWVADAAIEAARAYVRADYDENKEKVNQLYQQAISSKHEYFTALALWDQANRLMGDGKYLQVRALLLPVLGITDKTHPNEKTPQTYLNETGQIFLLSLVASSYYHTGEFDTSLKYAERAISLYELLDPIPEGTGVEGVAGISYELKQWIGQWRKSNLVVIPKQITLSETSSKQDIKIRSFSKRDLKVSSTDPHIETVVKDDWKEKEQGLYFERTLTVSLSNKDDKIGPATVITLSEPTMPEQNFTVDVLFKKEG